ncbi:MAG: Rossmann-like and DUF2520 domain-containing protein [Pyrinomonadaceae bacterium]
MNVTIVGVGKVGGALAIGLSEAGIVIRGLIVRDRSKAKRIRSWLNLDIRVDDWNSLSGIDSEVIIIASGDSQIPSVCESLSKYLRKGQTVLHTSGALSSDELYSLKNIGCETGSLHPLTSISDPISGSKQFRGSFFCVEGSRRAASAARKLAKNLGGKPFVIPKDKKPLYHAAAVMAAGHVTALFDCSLEALEGCGLDRQKGSEILYPLIASTIENLKSHSPEEAITGTLARLDLSTFQKHAVALQEVSDEILRIYLLLGERTLQIVSRGRHDRKLLNELRNAILLANESLR